ncbi:MAG: hypothetical protein ACHQFW_06220 [Chitinophagales bacterium]
MSIVEIMILTIKQDDRDKFHQLYLTLSAPLQKKWSINVVAHGPSIHDKNIYYVVRSFDSLEQRGKLLDDFYASDDWQKGPRTSILSLIKNISTSVISEEVFKEISSKVVSEE